MHALFFRRAHTTWTCYRVSRDMKALQLDARSLQDNGWQVTYCYLPA